MNITKLVHWLCGISPDQPAIAATEDFEQKPREPEPPPAKASPYALTPEAIAKIKQLAGAKMGVPASEVHVEIGPSIPASELAQVMQLPALPEIKALVTFGLCQCPRCRLDRLLAGARSLN